MRSQCWCGCTEFRTVKEPPNSKHYAGLICVSCGRNNGWLPFPRAAYGTERFFEAVARIAEQAPALDEPPPRLEGTTKQVEWATKVRADMLARIERVIDMATFRAMRGIADASWWIANREATTLRQVRWPSAWYHEEASA